MLDADDDDEAMEDDRLAVTVWTEGRAEVVDGVVEVVDELEGRTDYNVSTILMTRVRDLQWTTRSVGHC